MTVLWIDTDAACEATLRWDRLGEILHGRGGEVGTVGPYLDGVVGQRLAAAAQTLWSASAAVHRVLDELEGRRASPAEAAWSSGTALSPLAGDHGGTGTLEVRPPYTAAVVGGAVERGRGVVARALGDTGDPSRIRPDEFGLVRLAPDRFVVVLPGVVDLSHPRLGWDPRHRSVRDLDRAALASARTPGVDSNAYALAVWSALTAAGVPRGAELLVVGHSFGADTALDLAHDGRFNGSTGFRVTHVVAAGYHAGRHLGSGTVAFPGGTEVLVLQNRNDLAVVTEAAGLPFLAAIDDTLDGWRDLAVLDLPGGAAHQVAAARRPFEAIDSVARLVFGEPTTEATDGVVVTTFDGDRAGWGHDQDNYVRHLVGSREPAVVGFLESIDRAGYTERGEAVAIDLSVPVSVAGDPDGRPEAHHDTEIVSQKT